MGGKPAPEARKRINHIIAMLIMDEQRRVCSTRFQIGRHQSAQAPQSSIDGRQGVRGSPRGACGGALTTTRANQWINRNVIAIGRDGAGWAEIETARAACNA